MNKAILTPPIQEQSIPLVLGEGFNWLRTNRNWKTAAFAIPIIHQLHRIVGSSKKSQANSCISSYRLELAVQIGQSFDTYGKYTNLTQLTILVVFHKTHKLTP
jgi:ATP-dependent RNA helicase RhlE